jgi:hypothetical protein
MEYLKCFVLFYLNQSLWNLAAAAQAVVAAMAAVAVLAKILKFLFFDAGQGLLSARVAGLEPSTLV